jgi:hypothetical protein
MIATHDEEMVTEQFQRDELIALRERARQLANVPGTMRNWQEAYLAIANAADRLDAMIARTIVADSATETD